MMIKILNTFKTTWLPIFAVVTMFTSCERTALEIQDNFPFEVNVMPVPKELSEGETAEIRIVIQQMGNYKNTKYFLRYFQFDGKGTLRYYNTPPYLPNDSYPLPKEEFRLYYTSTSTVSQAFDIWISDNFGNERKLSFQFNNSN